MSGALAQPPPRAAARAMFADAAHLTEAFARLSPGASLVWATGPSTVAGIPNPTADLVAGWVKAGKATVARGPDPRAPGAYLHRVYLVAGQVAPRPPIGARLNLHATLVLELLEERAATGRACPSNEAIAEELGFDDRYRAKYRFNQLVEAGLIRVIEPNRFGARVIEIVASGARTASAEAGRR